MIELVILTTTILLFTDLLWARTTKMKNDNVISYIIFKNIAGDEKKIYLKNNPWKLSDHNREQKFFRYCIICGEERYNTSQWNNLSDTLANYFGPPAICQKNACWDGLRDIQSFGITRHLMHSYCSDARYKQLREEEQLIKNFDLFQ